MFKAWIHSYEAILYALNETKHPYLHIVFDIEFVCEFIFQCDIFQPLSKLSKHFQRVTKMPGEWVERANETANQMIAMETHLNQCLIEKRRPNDSLFPNLHKFWSDLKIGIMFCLHV